MDLQDAKYTGSATGFPYGAMTAGAPHPRPNGLAKVFPGRAENAKNERNAKNNSSTNPGAVIREGHSQGEKDMNARKTNRTYLTPNQVAELMMVSPATVRLWAQNGELNALTTPGGHRRFLHNEVERFARQRGLTLNPAGDDGMRILIVDDDEQLSRYLVELLEGQPEKIITQAADNGFVAGLKVREFQPHVILLDLMMPGLNGFEVCRLVKSSPRTKAIRVIAMTGYHTPENASCIVEAGAEACLPKPMDVRTLLDALRLQNGSSVSKMPGRRL